VGQLGFYFMFYVWACPSPIVKDAGRLGFRKAENYVDLCVPMCVPSLRGWRIEMASPTFV
jgi:hypothetical protein